MSTKLRTFDWSKPSVLTSAEDAAYTYPWTDWLDGDIWQLTKGEDFGAHPLMMERIIRTRSTGRGAKVQLRHQPLGDDPSFGIIVMQRTDIKGPNELKKEEQTAKRKAKKATAEQEAALTLEQAGIKPSKTAKPVSKVPAKRPVKKVGAAA
jgi:hypothetical protein